MIKAFDGKALFSMLEGGIRNVDLHRKELNDLNVFPVPDGDTGTNILMTLRQGLSASDEEKPLSLIAASFSSAAVLGARGNSGVIASQFFKGFSEGLAGLECADAAALSAAFVRGTKRAYASVAKPVEGTMLTVLREASEALSLALPLGSVDEAFEVLLSVARESLKRTPELLPVLKKAGVVDSGGAGMVYFLEGVKKHLAGESLELSDSTEAEIESVDLSLFNKDTDFEFGYCFEGVLQLTCLTEDFELSTFTERISSVGESVVTTLEGDKVKLHIHVKKLGRIMDICQEYGELLTLKIENMTVQHVAINGISTVTGPEKLIVREPDPEAEFSTVAVATTPLMQQRLFDMGADAVIFSEIAPSSEDFIEAFDRVGSSEILVYPNSSNSILAAMQAAGLYKNARVTVLNSRTVADCYASLSVLDFGGSAKEAIALTNSTVSSMRSFSVYHSIRDFRYGKRSVKKNEFFALDDKRLVGVGDTLEAVTLAVLSELFTKQEPDILTVFYGRNIADGYVEGLTERIKSLSPDLEIATVPTDETSYSLMISLE